MKAVFDAKAGSPYKDDVATHYHFPKRLYINEVLATRGDWIVYREPSRNGGSMAYFGTARVR
jgi:putative restriction endonuclease